MRKSATGVAAETVMDFFAESLRVVSSEEMDCEIAVSARIRRDALMDAGQAYFRQLALAEEFLEKYEANAL